MTWNVRMKKPESTSGTWKIRFIAHVFAPANLNFFKQCWILKRLCLIRRFPSELRWSWLTHLVWRLCCSIEGINNYTLKIQCAIKIKRKYVFFLIFQISFIYFFHSRPPTYLYGNKHVGGRSSLFRWSMHVWPH